MSAPRHPGVTNDTSVDDAREEARRAERAAADAAKAAEKAREYRIADLKRRIDKAHRRLNQFFDDDPEAGPIAAVLLNLEADLAELVPPAHRRWITVWDEWEGCWRDIPEGSDLDAHQRMPAEYF